MKIAANRRLGHKRDCFAAKRFLRLNALDQAWPKNLSAVCNRRNHGGDLQWGDIDRSLSDREVEGVSHGPTPQVLERRTGTARFMSRFKLRFLAEMKFLSN